MKATDILYILLFITEVISFLTGLFFLKELKQKAIKNFVLYLGIIVLSELLYDILLRNEIHFQHLHTFFVIPLEFLFFHWFYYQFSTIEEKRRIIICAIIYMVAFFVERFFLIDSSKFVFFSFSYSVGNIVLLFIVFQYFFKLVNSDKLLYFYHERLFWISCGLLMFYLGSSPFYGMYNFLYNGHKSIIMTYGYIVYFLNCTMYLLFAASFIWGKEK